MLNLKFLVEGSILRHIPHNATSCKEEIGLEAWVSRHAPLSAATFEGKLKKLKLVETWVPWHSTLNAMTFE